MIEAVTADSIDEVLPLVRKYLEFYQVKIPNEILPSLILSVEMDELGIKSGRF